MSGSGSHYRRNPKKKSKPKTEKEKEKEAEEQARRYADAKRFFEQPKRERAGLPSGRAIGKRYGEKCHDDNLKVEERLMKLTYAPPEGTANCPAAITNLTCPKDYTAARKKFVKLAPDRNAGCTDLAAEMMKKYQECCYAAVENPRETLLKWDRNNRNWRNPIYEAKGWYSTPITEEAGGKDTAAELDAIQAGFSSKRGDFSDSSLERELAELEKEETGQTPTTSDVERELAELERGVNVEDLRKQFEAEYRGDLERAKKAEMEKKATKIQALQRGRTSRRKNPSAALCRMCKAPGFYDPKCDQCPGSKTVDSDEYSMPSAAQVPSGPIRSVSRDYTDPPTVTAGDEYPPAIMTADPDFDCGSLNAPSGWIDMRSKRTRQDNRKTCRKKQNCMLDKHKNQNKSRCVTRKKGRKKKKRKPKRICAETKDCPENQICKDNFCVPVEAGMVRPVGAALPRTDPGAILTGQAATVEGKSAAALRRADEERRRRIRREDGDIAPPRPSNIGPKADARAEEARDPMVDFHSYLSSDDCPKLTAKEIKDLANLFD